MGFTSRGVLPFAYWDRGVCHCRVSVQSILCGVRPHLMINLHFGYRRGLRATFVCDWSHTLILFIIIYIVRQLAANSYVIF